MKHTFRLRTRPFSINSATYGDARTKTREYFDWSAQVFHQLSSTVNQEKLKELRDLFDESKHSFKISIKVVYPKDQFITKQNILSSRSIDCSNFEKLLVDLFFDKQFFDRPHPRGCPNINQNDKHIVALYSSKTYHELEHHEINFTVKIVSRSF